MVIGIICGLLAAAVHVLIFVLESLRWTDEKTRATFKMTLEQANSTREMAFNQGFYNLFLALEVMIGLLLATAGYRSAGYALMLFGMASMTAAALLLFVTSPDKRSAALKQGTFPTLGLLAMTWSLW